MNTNTTATYDYDDNNNHNRKSLDQVLSRIKSIARRFSDDDNCAAPVKGHASCLIVEFDYDKIPKGFSRNHNGLIRTRFCNAYFSVAQLVAFHDCLMGNKRGNSSSSSWWNKSSFQQQSEAFFKVFEDSRRQGLEVSHLCDVQNCVEPTHIILESRSCNMSRRSCPGYCIHKQHLLRLCKHDPPCVRVTSCKEVVSSAATPSSFEFTSSHLPLFKTFGRLRDTHRRYTVSKALQHKEETAQKAKASREVRKRTNSKADRIIVRKEKIAKKRKAERKERKRKKKRRMIDK